MEKKKTRKQLYRKKHKKGLGKFLFMLVVLIGVSAIGVVAYHALIPKQELAATGKKKTAETTTEAEEKQVETPAAIKGENVTKPNPRAIEQNDTVPKVEDVAAIEIDKLLQSKSFTGTAYIVKNGNEIFRKGYEANENAPMPLGSMEKSMTAVLLGKAIQEKKLTLQTKLATFYPNAPNANILTLNHLLTMTSGLSDNPKIDVTFLDTQENYLQQHIQSTYAKGQIGVWNYDAANYWLLAGILEKVNNEPFEKQFKTFFEKYKLDFQNYAQTKSSPVRVYNYAMQKEDQRNPAGNDVSFTNEVGTGNMFTSAENLYRYYKKLLTYQFLPKNVTLELLTPYAEGKGYSGGLYTIQPENYHWGRGVIKGFESTASISKDGKNAVILFSDNFEKETRAFTTVNRSIFKYITTGTF